MGVEEARESCEREVRERVETDETTAARGVEVEATVAAAERRVRLVERVVGPVEEEEGADEVASARFRLRVSIQNPQTSELAHQSLSDPEIVNVSKSSSSLNPSFGIQSGKFAIFVERGCFANCKNPKVRNPCVSEQTLIGRK